VLFRKISREHVRFPGNDISKFPAFSWPGEEVQSITIDLNS